MSNASTISSSGSSEIDTELFGPLAAISEDSLIKLACRIGQDVLNIPSDDAGEARFLKRICGSYNIVHVMKVGTTKLVIRVPATGWVAGMTKAAANALESQVATMRLIRRKTQMPVSEVYTFDTTNNNEISAPFICMSFIPGETVLHVWLDDSLEETSRDNLRLNILTSIAKSMAQLSSLNFDRIGSIMEEEEGTLGPTFDWDVQTDGSVRVIATRTYVSVSEYLACQMDLGHDKNPWDRASRKMVEALVQSSPDLDSHSRFVLCPPDFDSQNILVDPNSGNVTGFIDWDLAQTMPPHIGYARYPGLITRDWDPLMYGYPVVETEDSPERLQRYREHYNIKLGEALYWKGDWKFTKNSHISEAVWNAALNSLIRMGIVSKFVATALGIQQQGDALSVLYDIADDGYSQQDWDNLKVKLTSLVRGTSFLAGAA